MLPRLPFVLTKDIHGNILKRRTRTVVVILDTFVNPIHNFLIQSKANCSIYRCIPFIGQSTLHLAPADLFMQTPVQLLLNHPVVLQLLRARCLMIIIPSLEYILLLHFTIFNKKA